MYLVLSIVGGGQRGASHVFDRHGGIIGRSTACDWQLQDPTNTISGRHAAISFADNRFFISDTSTNGTFINGSPTPIGKGRAAALKPGDQIVIGDMVISAEVVDRLAEEPAHVAPDIGAHAQVTGPAAARPRAAPVHSAEALAGLSSPSAARGGDVLGALGPGASAPPSTHVQAVGSALDDLVGGSANGVGALLPPAHPAASSAHPQSLLPGNLGHAPAPAPAPAASPAHAAPDAGQAIPDYLSVDYLLSGKRTGEAPPEISPAAEVPQAMPVQPAPQAAMPISSPPGPAPVPPQSLPPEHAEAPTVAAPAVAAPPPPPAPSVPEAELSEPPAAAPPPGNGLSPALQANYVELGNGRVSAPAAVSPAALDPVSILRQRSETRERARAAPVAEAAQPTPAAPVGAGPVPRRAATNPFPKPTAADIPAAPDRAAAFPPAAAVPPQQAVGSEGAAFWAGLGIDPGHVPPDRRVELLEEVGRALRELGQGLVEVLAARRSLKDEFRMEQTRLQATENNPFKFFSSGEKALARIIVGEGGYMRVDEAVRESFRDIKAHEMAAVAALHAALSHVLSELDPQAMAKGADQRGLFGRGEDKKALWERFVERHAALAGDVEGTAKGIVSRAFMEAYERQLGQMKGDGL